MKEEDTPTVFTDGKQNVKSNDQLSGYAKPTVKVLAIMGLILVLAVIVVTHDWTYTVRESGISAEVQKTNSLRLEIIEREYVRRVEIEKLDRRMERIEDKLDRVLQIQAQRGNR